MESNVIRTLLIIGLAFVIGMIPVIAQDDPPVDTDGDDIVIDTEEAAETVIQITETTAEGISGLVNDFLNRLYSISQNEIVQVLMVIVGAILLVAGWRIYNWIIVIAGALVGGTLALAAVGEAGVVIEVAAFLIGAAIGGTLGYFVYYLAVFVIGAYIGIVFTTLIAQSLDLLPVSPILLLIIAIVAGVVMLGLSFELLVLLASLLGAQLIVMALGLTPAGIWLMVLILAGVIIQVGLTRRAGYKIRRRPTRRMIFN